MASIRVGISGVAGRMGRAAVRAVARESDMTVVAAVGRERGVGQDAGEVAGAGRLGVPIAASLEEIFAASPEVLVEFAPGLAGAQHALAAIEAGVHPVVGATGIATNDVERLRDAAARLRVGAVIAPNFAIGAVLMMEFARLAAPFMPHVEIIELHHDRKRDAPSGTAAKTAGVIAQARGLAPSPSVDEEEMIRGVRGGQAEGVRVHSVRLPGLGAHQEVIFGGPGQTLTIRHDSLNEESFMPGLLLAIRRVRELEGLVFGLEHLLGLR
jgi:4-hydroxy-tetrahydrodipicolinate reductase